MLKISRETSSRETVFVLNSKVADFKFRFMTPKRELDFSGHPTIAAFHALVEIGLIEVVRDETMLSLETNNGVLEIEIVKNETTGLHEIQITHQRPQFLNTYDPKDYTEALGLSLADILSPNPIQTVSTGTPSLLVPVSSMKSLERLKPNWDRLKELREDADYVSIHVFAREGFEVTSDAHSRNFAPALGVYEDPVSGVAAGCVGSYLVNYGIMDSVNQVTSIIIEQGHFMNRPSKTFVEVRGSRNEIEQVKVSGTAVTVMNGTLLI